VHLQPILRANVSSADVAYSQAFSGGDSAFTACSQQIVEQNLLSARNYHLSGHLVLNPAIHSTHLPRMTHAARRLSRMSRESGIVIKWNYVVEPAAAA